MEIKTKEQIIQSGCDLIVEELKRARVKFPEQTNSPHEGFAVLKEEFDELKDEMHFMKQHIKDLWGDVRTDNYESQIDELDRIIDRSRDVIYEAVQFGAMALKWKEDFAGR